MMHQWGKYALTELYAAFGHKDIMYAMKKISTDAGPHRKDKYS